MATPSTHTSTQKRSARAGQPAGGARTGGRTFRGTVVSTKMRDTITVAVDRYVKHPKYKKYVRHTKKYLVDDKGNTAQTGEKVLIRETRPISKRKKFILVSQQSAVGSQQQGAGGDSLSTNG